jgi:NAD(P)-dependent dehydrogenase (short-subunit alcohol dehydrogenase family)
MNTSPGTVIVTGGASGLGDAVVRAVAKAGGRAVVLDQHEPPDDSPADGSVKVDLGDGRAAEAAVREVADDYAGLHAVVTAAGIDSCGKLEDVDADQWETVVRVNLLGTVAVVRAALPWLREQHGRIVTVGSTLGLRALSDATAYCAAKFGVTGFTRALTIELAGVVGVTMLVPGGMQTPFFDGREPQYQPSPEARLNAPSDVASAVLFVLAQPPGCEIRELIVSPSVEPSWP